MSIRTHHIIQLILCIVFLLAGNAMLFSQRTFSLIIPSDTVTPDGRHPTAWGGNVIALDSGRLMLIENGYKNLDSIYRETKVRILDSEGNTIRSDLYSLEGKSWLHGLGYDANVVLKNGEIMLTGLVLEYDGFSVRKALSNFVKFDRQGNLIWSKVFDLDDDERFLGMAATRDTAVIAVGYHKAMGGVHPRQPLMLKIDQHGDTAWVVKDEYRGFWYYQGIATNGFDLMLTGDWEYDYTQTSLNQYYQGFTTLIANQNQGPYRYPTRYWGNRGETTYGQAIIPYLDQGFLMLTIEPGKLQPTFSLRDTQKLRRLDYEGKLVWEQNIVWENTYPINNRFVQILRSLPDGSIILAGIAQHRNSVPYIQKRTEQGEVLWERWLPVCENCSHQILDLEVLEDGFAISGSVNTRGVQGQRAYIIRTDSTGCVTPGCKDRQGPFVSIDDEAGLEGISVFPNPAQQTVYIESQTQAITVEIFDTQGKKMTFSKANKLHQINIAAYPTGLYFYRATDAKGKSTSGKFTVL